MYGSVGEISLVRYREFNVRVVFDVYLDIFMYMLLFLCNLLVKIIWIKYIFLY